ncbi:aspartate kinase [Halobacillus litoralis]|uniref:Aspartokinase n=1 Tax=Halobacillus litoralis TaxID=45668 RepID=A0A410MIB5_9BACI|nr:aspartate kinase [Halobacillus litoralis]QAS54433.1 aspartate kinase [Halobacillus litoralis]
MAIVVQKYGGSSLGTTEKIQNVTERIIEEKEKGQQVVVVVSAMGDATNHLVQSARDISLHPDARDMDLLISTGEQVTSSLMSLALKERGADAISMTGWQAGIQTEESFGNAAISSIDLTRIHQHLQKGKIVVVAGFQGCTSSGEICTLGRGGSDTTAAALAAELKAIRCDIFTDVDGVYTADPRVMKNARKLPSMNYEGLLNLAKMGAKVIHPRAVQHAKEHQVPLVVRSSFNKEEGTSIHHHHSVRDDSSAIGLTFEEGLSRVRLYSSDGEPLKSSALLQLLKKEEVTIKGNQVEADGSFTVILRNEDLYQTLSCFNRNKEKIGIGRMNHSTGLAAAHLVFIDEQSADQFKSRLSMPTELTNTDLWPFSSRPEVYSVLVDEKQAGRTCQILHDSCVESCLDLQAHIN